MEIKNNPYLLLFGKKPEQIIPRASQRNEIIEEFQRKIPGGQVYVITGVRGSGKTVFMTDIAGHFQQKPDWKVVELNPERDMLLSLAASLCSDDKLAMLFHDAKLNLSFFGIGLEITTTVPITDIEVALRKMLEVLKKRGKRVLITVDEAMNSKDMRIFASAFQILIRQDLPVYLLMTGLYENIDALQNAKNLTFLYRAPKIDIKPLNLGIIADNYKKVLGVDEETARYMSKHTKGYSFAFQVLGHFAWEHRGMTEEVEKNYKQYLDDYVYDKIWSEMSMGDRRLAYGIAKSGDGKISTVRSILGIDTNQFNPYRKRLARKGLVNGDTYGFVSFTLPLFDRYVLENY